jgi:hypothetical protein
MRLKIATPHVRNIQGDREVIIKMVAKKMEDKKNSESA